MVLYLYQSEGDMGYDVLYRGSSILSLRILIASDDDIIIMEPLSKILAIIQ